MFTLLSLKFLSQRCWPSVWKVVSVACLCAGLGTQTKQITRCIETVSGRWLHVGVGQYTARFGTCIKQCSA
jgi:hypothetical protein